MAEVIVIGAGISGLAAAYLLRAGLFLTGNYFSGVSTAACIEQASATAGRVLNYLASSRSCGRRERPPQAYNLPESGGIVNAWIAGMLPHF